MDTIFRDIELFKEQIDKYENITLTAHVNPDGDSIGSSLALANFLKESLNKDVTVLIDSTVSSSFKFLPNFDKIKTDTSDVKKLELLITLDCGNKDRLALSEALIDSADYVINIDHHVTNTLFGDLNFLDTKSSSTGEVIYELISRLGFDVSKETAACLYTSISTDTGSFKYTNTTSRTHVIASKLLEKGIDLETINIELYQNTSLEKTKLLMEGINQLTLLKDNTVGISAITNEILDKFNAKTQDTEPIVDFIRNIDVVQLACVIRPIDENSSKVSMRAKKNIDVSKIALVFGGGGHAKAAGCTINADVLGAKEIITKEILNYLGD